MFLVDPGWARNSKCRPKKNIDPKIRSTHNGRPKKNPDPQNCIGLVGLSKEQIENLCFEDFINLKLLDVLI